MDTVVPTNHIKDSECAAFILDSNLPNAAADICKWPTAQRLFAKLQQVEFTTYVGTDCSRKLSDDIQRIAVPIDVL